MQLEFNYIPEDVDLLIEMWSRDEALEQLLNSTKHNGKQMKTQLKLSYSKRWGGHSREVQVYRVFRKLWKLRRNGILRKLTE